MPALPCGPGELGELGRVDRFCADNLTEVTSIHPPAGASALPSLLTGDEEAVIRVGFRIFTHSP